MSRTKSAMSGHEKAKKSGKKPHSIHVRHAASGGYIATHHHKPSKESMLDSSEPEDHILPDMQALQQHMADNMPQPEDQGQPSPDQSGGAPPPPPQAAPAPAPGM